MRNELILLLLLAFASDPLELDLVFHSWTLRGVGVPLSRTRGSVVMMMMMAQFFSSEADLRLPFDPNLSY